ncbi:MAG: hypothetical protein ACYTE8_05310 [Planctomycetota bacterium]|jgi:hypothetical protein
MLKRLFVILLSLTLMIMSSCSLQTSTIPPPAQLKELIKQNLVLLPDSDFDYLPSDLKENEIIFLGEIHKMPHLYMAASRLAIYLANHKPVVYAVECNYSFGPFLEAASLGNPKSVIFKSYGNKPVRIHGVIEAFNSGQTADRKILMTALDLEHSVYHTKSDTVLFLQDLANRSSSDTTKQIINEKIIQLTDQDTYDKMNSYLEELKKVFLQHLNTFSSEDRDEILFSMELLMASNYYQYHKKDYKNDRHNAHKLRYRYFKKTIERAYRKAKKREAILLCRVGNTHARLDYKLEARYFAKKYSPTKGKVAAINMVPLYYDARETNDAVTEEHNNIDSIVKTLMKDYEYSYLALSELQQKTNNSFKWSKYYSNSGPKYDGLLFVRIERNSN